MKQKHSIVNPSTGKVIAEVNLADEQDVDAALDSARGAFDHGGVKGLSLAQRRDILLKVSKGILEKASELARLETLNTGKPIKESTFMDIPSAAKTFEYFANNLEEYLKDEIRIVSEDAQARLLRGPVGVAVLIVPWNYPLLIAAWKIAPALAAGNSVVLKPSSLTPLTALELNKIIQEAGLPKGMMNLVMGNPEVIGQVLCSDKRVDMISFTGSNSSGRKILEYAAKNVKKLVIELGGKSASIVLKDADLELAVNGSLCSIFLNQGQMCTAMSRIFVEDSVYERFVDDFAEKTKRIKLGDGLDYETQMGPLISPEQRDKVISFVEQAKEEGAMLLCGGKIPDDSNLKNGLFFEPTVFTQVNPQMQIFKQEIFGPVVLIQRFSRIEEAIELANKSDFALAAAVWSQDIEKAQALSTKINAGTVWINTYGMFYNELPYGGFKQSGFGKELGKEGFLEYTCLKNVVIGKTEKAKPLVNYWYGL